MNINQLIKNVKRKISNEISFDNILIIDETSKHLNHKSHTLGKFHLKIIITSKSLRQKNKIQSSRLIYKIIDYEIKNHIHSVQLDII